MPGTAELAIREDGTAPALRLPALPSLPDTDSWIRAMASIAKLAAQICNTSFVPKGLRGDDAAVTAAILTGRELGLPPMAALRHIHVVEGTPSLDAEYKRAKVLSLGHEFDIVEWDNEHCIISGRRKGSTKPPLVVSYTMKDARTAQLVKDRGNYMTRPKVMMLARATTLICNAIFADVTNGLATTELLEAGDADAIADAEGAALPMPDAPQRQRVSGEEARARAPQRVTAEVVDVQPDERQCPEALHDPADGSVNRCQLPGGHEGRHKSGVVTWSDTPPAPPEQPADEAVPEPEATADPRDAVLARFEQLGVTGPDIASYLTRLAGRDFASVESLNHAQATWFVDRLGKLTTRDELEAAATAAEARREAPGAE